LLIDPLLQQFLPIALCDRGNKTQRDENIRRNKTRGETKIGTGHANAHRRSGIAVIGLGTLRLRAEQRAGKDERIRSIGLPAQFPA
jgi:hypothetical protein